MRNLASGILAVLGIIVVACGSTDDSSGQTTAGACQGSCDAPGSTCTIDPPAGTDVMSTVCVCSSAGAWECDDSNKGGSSGATGSSGSAGTSAGGSSAGGSSAVGGKPSNGGAGGAQCEGECSAYGLTCSINPPPGSLAPSIQCICDNSQRWCCDGNCLLDGTGGYTAGGFGGLPSGGVGGYPAGGLGGFPSGGVGGYPSGGVGGVISGGVGGFPSGGVGGVGGFPSGGAGAIGGTGGGCAQDCASQGLVCCAGTCVNTSNDVLNCGVCGNACAGSSPYCGYGACGTPPCSGPLCGIAGTCCGSQCCGVGQLCCDVNIGPSVTGCYDAVNGTCPVGCPMCECASADTLVATPSGDVPIHALHEGDLVYSVDHDAIVAVPLLMTNRIAVSNHVMVHARLSDGSVVQMSPRHPTADGKRFDTLRPGDALGEVRIEAITVEPYLHAHTYDLLPASDSGAYFANGAIVGSTLKR